MPSTSEHKKGSIAVVFTQGVGLGTWLGAGFAAREIDYYKDIADKVGSVTFLTYDKGNPRNIRNLPDLGSIDVQFNRWSLDRRIFSLLAPIFKYRSLRTVDVVKTTQHRGSWTALLLKWLLRKPMVARCGYVWSLFEQRQGASPGRMRVVKFLEGFVLRRADAIAVPDQHGINYLSDLHRIPKEKFTVLPNFVDTDQFVPGAESDRDRAHFVYIGRLENDQKRPQLAAKAAQLVPESRLDMIGKGPDHDVLKTLTDDIANVRLRGIIPYADVADLMNGALGLIIPSRYEGHPKVVIEAMASGLPVIATRSQGLVELVEDGVNGLLVDPDPESIAAAMRKLMGDFELWQVLSQGARRSAVERYSRTSVLNQEISLLTKLMKG